MFAIILEDGVCFVVVSHEVKPYDVTLEESFNDYDEAIECCAKLNTPYTDGD